MSIEEQNEVKKEYHSEAIRYMSNARDTLKKAGKKDEHYKDTKYVKTACGTAYNGVLTALNGYFLTKQIPKQKGRKSIEYYKDTLSKLDKKLLADLHDVYEILHLSGYYDGISNVQIVQAGFGVADRIIKRIEPSSN